MHISVIAPSGISYVVHVVFHGWLNGCIGFKYERSQIELHINKHGPVGPITGLKLTTDMLRPNKNGLRDPFQKHPREHLN